MNGIKLVVIAAMVVVLSACASAEVRHEQAQMRKASADNTNLGLIYLQRNEKERALVKLRKAIDEDPTNAKAHTAIALVYEGLGRVDLAADHYAKAVELDPKDSYAHNAYGVFLCHKGKVDAALKHFEAAINDPLYPQPEVALTNAGQCVRSRDRALAEKYLRSALRRNPKYPSALFMMSGISYDKGNALSARGYLQRYLAVAKHTPQTLWLGIQVERELGDLNAVASYSLLLKRQFPDSEEAQRLQASEH